MVIWKLDRLGRTLGGLVKLAETLREHGIHLSSVTDGFDTATPAGRFFFNMMASLAEMERDLMRERATAGLAAARERGRLGGRRQTVTDGQAEAARGLIASGNSMREAAAKLGLSKSALHRRLSQLADPAQFLGGIGFGWDRWVRGASCIHQAHDPIARRR